MPPSNRAAYLMGTKVKPLKVDTAPYTAPQRDQLVIKARALAVNPVDWGKQTMGDNMYGHLKYPIILGNDVAGTVVEVGPGVTRFKVGDRVLGNAVGMDKRSSKELKGNNAESAYQEYVVLRTNLTSQIPDSMSFEDACVIPLAASTAACGLFMKDFLALPPPLPNDQRKDRGEVLLIWGGSTSVGCNAIQLARAAGYEIWTTCSPKNNELVKRLGASKVFDYRSPTVIRDIIASLKPRLCAGAMAIGEGSLAACFQVVNVAKFPAGRQKFVTQITFGGSDILTGEAGLAGLLGTVAGMVWTTTKGRFKGIRSKFVFGTDLMANEVGKMVYEDYLPKAMAEGSFVPAPEPMVVGKGLEKMQEAFELQIKGVSAKKVVVSLD